MTTPNPSAANRHELGPEPPFDRPLQVLNALQRAMNENESPVSAGRQRSETAARGASPNSDTPVQGSGDSDHLHDPGDIHSGCEFTAWLIERPDEPGRPLYWLEAPEAVEALGTWVHDPWNATHYATRENAEREIRRSLHPFIPRVIDAKAVSHGFVLERGHGVLLDEFDAERKNCLRGDHG